MKIIDDLLLQLEHSIANNKYTAPSVKNVTFYGDNPANWQQAGLFVNINALLNTDGGIIVIGVHNDKAAGRYVFSGYNSGPELALPHFTDNSYTPASVTDYIHYHTKHFLNGEVLVVLVEPLPHLDRYVYLDNVAHVLVNNVAQPISTLTNTEEDQEEGTQKIYSAELITLFGADYISMEPDAKQLLSFIYEKNNATEERFPTANEIIHRFRVITGGIENPKLQEQHAAKVKKTLSQLEKGNFILRQGGKAAYKVNIQFSAVKSLFN